MGVFVRFFVTLDASEVGSLTAFSFAFIVGVCVSLKPVPPVYASFKLVPLVLMTLFY